MRSRQTRLVSLLQGWLVGQEIVQNLVWIEKRKPGEPESQKKAGENAASIKSDQKIDFVTSHGTHLALEAQGSQSWSRL